MPAEKEVVTKPIRAVRKRRTTPEPAEEPAEPVAQEPAPEAEAVSEDPSESSIRPFMEFVDSIAILKIIGTILFTAGMIYGVLHREFM